MKSRIRVKICGITNLADAQAAVRSGADALGFNTYHKSPRCISPQQIKLIVDRLPPFICNVGLFVNASEAFVLDACSQVRFDLLQFHGDETNDYCRQFGVPFIKAIRVQSLAQLKSEAGLFPDSQGILFDAYAPNALGGTGKSFDWSLLVGSNASEKELDNNVILAGGLNVDNVGLAIATVEPYSVDVSSGIEISPGRKDHQKMQKFIGAVNFATQQTGSND
ncbi:MAG: phosphoribosylanthranilate isomerase [Candidatus Azotimanducaceae bacterium]|jgi:phosphoribosylanthranilate isomerase